MFQVKILVNFLMTGFALLAKLVCTFRNKSICVGHKWFNFAIFFWIQQGYLPNDTPLGLKELREKELRQLRGNGEGIRTLSEFMTSMFIMT